jgi:hypothetical protein
MPIGNANHRARGTGLSYSLMRNGRPAAKTDERISGFSEQSLRERD